VLASVMAIPRRTCCLAVAMAGMLGLPAAWADVYVWVDALGHTNVSNLAPPDDAKVKNVIKSVPRTAAQEEAARAATQRAEMQALNDRVAMLQDQLEQSRREAAVMPAAYAPPPVVYAPPPQYSWAQPPAPYVADTAPESPWGWGCDYSPWSNCGFGFGGWPYVAVVVPNNGKHFHRGPGHGLRPMPPTPKWTGPVRPLGASTVRPLGASTRRG
jgi:hypothetical protein